MFINHYEILGVEPSADLVQITAAWKRLMKKYHPDLNQDDQDANEQAILINKAYEILSDSTKRQKFDQQLERRQQASNPAEDVGESREPATPKEESASQSDAPQPRQSQAAATKRNAKKNQHAAAMTIVGIVLGLLTAIPIGLFLVWSISGFDPLGIFRQRDTGAFVANREPNENANEERNSKNEQGKTGQDSEQNKSTDLSTDPAKKNATTPNTKTPITKDTVKPDAGGGTEEKQPTDKKSNSNTVEEKSPPKQTPKTEKEKSGTPVESQPKPVALLEIPADEAVLSAKKKIGDAFSLRFREADSADGIDRLENLRDLALEINKLTAEENEPSVLYALYDVSLDIGKRSYFANEVLEIVDQFESRFKIDGLATRYDLFQFWYSELGQVIRDKNDRRAAAGRLSSLVAMYFARTLDEKNWPLAASYAELNRKMLAASGDSEASMAQLKPTTVLKRFAKQKSESEKVRVELADNPNQPDKQLVVGSYLGFVEGNWDQALPYLKKCGDPELARLAELDLAADPSTYTTVGEGWLKLARSTNYAENYQSAMAGRARTLYQLALKDAKGLVRQTIVRLIADSTDLMDQNDPFRLVRRHFKSDSTGMEFIKVMPGTFTMGETASKGYPDASPPHKVKITKPFFLGKYEVTQEEWTRVMGTKPWVGIPMVLVNPKAPANSITFLDTIEFCKRLSEIEGRVYRLPTEAEWEYACRAGTTTAYSWGNSGDDFAKHGWYRRNAWYIADQKFAHKVGLMKPNPWGFYDIHGNVREWCLDYYDSGFYAKSPSEDPVNKVPNGKRALRGGSFYYHDFMGRSAVRFTGIEAAAGNDIGLRVVCEIKSGTATSNAAQILSSQERDQVKEKLVNTHWRMGKINFVLQENGVLGTSYVTNGTWNVKSRDSIELRLHDGTVLLTWTFTDTTFRNVSAVWKDGSITTAQFVK